MSGFILLVHLGSEIRNTARSFSGAGWLSVAYECWTLNWSILYFLGYLMCVILIEPKVKQNLEVSRTKRQEQLFKPAPFSFSCLG